MRTKQDWMNLSQPEIDILPEWMWEHYENGGLRKPAGLMNRFDQAFLDPLGHIFKRALRAYNRNKRKEDKDV